MAKPTTYRRRKFLVNRGIQLRFLGLLVLQMTAVLAGLAFLVRSQLLRINEIAALVPNVGTASRMRLEQELIAATQGFGNRSLLMLLATGVVILVLGLLASHRLAGPAVKFERFLHRLADGDYSQRIAFRGTDHLDFFAERINRTMESIERRQLRAGQLAQALLRKGEDLASATDRKATIAEMNTLVAELKGAI